MERNHESLRTSELLMSVLAPRLLHCRLLGGFGKSSSWSKQSLGKMCRKNVQRILKMDCGWLFLVIGKMFLLCLCIAYFVSFLLLLLPVPCCLVFSLVLLFSTTSSSLFCHVLLFLLFHCSSILKGSFLCLLCCKLMFTMVFDRPVANMSPNDANSEQHQSALRLPDSMCLPFGLFTVP